MHPSLLGLSCLVWRKCGMNKKTSLRAKFNHAWKGWIKSSPFVQSYGSHWVENVCFSEAKRDGRTMEPGNESRHDVSTPWYGGCCVAVVVHETGRAAVSKLCSPPAGRNIFSAALSDADINCEISPQRKENLVLEGENETFSKSGVWSFYLLSLFLVRNVARLKIFLRA